VVRIALGGVLLLRYGGNAWAVAHLQTPPSEVVAAAFELTASVLFLVGFMTPLAAFSLFLAQWRADETLHVFSLSTMTLQMSLVVMALLPAGTRLSIDALLLDRWRPLASLYALWGSPTGERARLLRLVAFIAYGASSLTAVRFHLADPLWRSGAAQVYVFTNPFFSRHADIVRGLAERWPGAALTVSKVMTVGMLSWEASMVPLALLGGRWGRRVVAGYGFAFFGMSALCLRLAWLSYLEMALWALVFWAGAPVRLPRLDAGRRTWIGAGVVALGVLGLFPVRGARFLVPIRQHLGVGPVDVFNRIDLSTNTSFATVSRIATDGGEILLPLNGPNGARLAWYGSDRIFYGLGLAWRRERIGHERDCWIDAIDRPRVDQLVEYDRELGAPAASLYAVRFFAGTAPEAERIRLAAPEVVCALAYGPQAGDVVVSAP
jgi:hypothetical protein